MSITAAKVRAPLMRLCAALTRCLQPEPEGVQHRLMAPALAPQRMEVRRPVVAGDHRLAVDQERRCLDAERSINDGREAVGPVMAALGEAADARAVPAHHQPVAVVFDFVNPQRAGRWPRHLRQQARFDEAGRTAHDHDRRIEQWPGCSTAPKHGGIIASMLAVPSRVQQR
jgi:hypothetical protein